MAALDQHIEWPAVGGAATVSPAQAGNAACNPLSRLGLWRMARLMRMDGNEAGIACGKQTDQRQP
ncbi:hypothetical protein P3W85_05735 [Cupriavidus basilensis]|uniref:Uncharacterized protein n=1 Tax=Cupriavidus basilensis TaxID=68895 RepID=A0ABT6AIK9_9BURK|nr:hypothetical protein [Cupriavidus basilensis]MDF3832445.1 hypothetical protein [Cupriavidus basilensis]